MKLSRNWKDYALVPYYLTIAILVVLPLAIIMYTGIALRVIGTELENLSLFRTTRDLFWLDRISKWKNE